MFKQLPPSEKKKELSFLNEAQFCSQHSFQTDLPPPLMALEATLMTSVAMALGEYLSRAVATTGNWYSMRYVLHRKRRHTGGCHYCHPQCTLLHMLHLTAEEGVTMGKESSSRAILTQLRRGWPCGKRVLQQLFWHSHSEVEDACLIFHPEKDDNIADLCKEIKSYKAIFITVTVRISAQFLVQKKMTLLWNCSKKTKLYPAIFIQHLVWMFWKRKEEKKRNCLHCI